MRPITRRLTALEQKMEARRPAEKHIETHPEAIKGTEWATLAAWVWPGRSWRDPSKEEVAPLFYRYLHGEAPPPDFDLKEWASDLETLRYDRGGGQR